MAKKLTDIKGFLVNLPFWVFWILIFSLPIAYPPIIYFRDLAIQLTDILFLINGVVWLLFLFRRV